MVRGKFTKRRGGMLLGRIYFEKNSILLKYLFRKKRYSYLDIESISYTYCMFSRGGYLKYFCFIFKDERKIYVFEKSNTNQEDLCRDFIKRKLKKYFINSEIERLKN